ncbi:hypothetical protein K440DRAFT_679792, partial [Wilcoxina mikolae CBS 423.85]
ECLKSLKFENTRYHKIASHHEGSLEWLWSHDAYLKWANSDTSHLLYLQGKPGSGKSTLTRYLKEHLQAREPAAKSALISSFFYSFREGESQRNHYNMLRSILYDIIDQEESFFHHMQSQYRKYQELIKQKPVGDRTTLHYECLQRVLRLIGSYITTKRVYLVIDAVDESCCDDRRDILQLLFQLCTNSSCTVKVFIASRPVGELDHLICAHHSVIRMQDVNRVDIQIFIESFLGPELSLPMDMCREITEYLLVHCQGVFLWVRLIRDQLIEYVEQGWSKNEIFQFLQSLPTELEEMYSLILKKLESSDGRGLMGKRMFELVLFARRPLRVLELQHALAVSDIPTISWSPPSENSFRDNLIVGIEKRIVHCGGNLLECKGHEGNLPQPVIQVMHQTVREFFLQPAGAVAVSKFRMDGNAAHVRIAVTCLRYMMFCIASRTHPASPVASWSSRDFAIYARHLNERPLLFYALSHLKDHFD